MFNKNTFYPTSQAFSVEGRGDCVAIITRTKNRPVLLARAFSSMLAQTHHNWHLYLVNDGGDPGPVEELVARYKPAFGDRLTVKHHAHSMGMEAASNSGLAEAGGDYVVIHDDDDSWGPEFLEKTIAFLVDPANTRFAAVATNCEVIYEEIVGGEVIERGRSDWDFWKDRVDMLDIFKINNIPPICTLIRKDAVDLIGPYNDQLPVLGDWDYNLRILLLADIGTINEPLANYHHRVTHNSSGTYSNSVHGGKNKHLDYQTLYRNSIIRKLLRREPAYVGLLHVFLRRMDDLETKLNCMHWDINHQEKIDSVLWRVNHQPIPDLESLNQAAATLRAIAPTIQSLSTLLRPLRWVWRLMYPLRWLIAKLRGRI